MARNRKKTISRELASIRKDERVTAVARSEEQKSRTYESGFKFVFRLLLLVPVIIVVADDYKLKLVLDAVQAFAGKHTTVELSSSDTVFKYLSYLCFTIYAGVNLVMWKKGGSLSNAIRRTIEEIRSLK